MDGPNATTYASDLALALDLCHRADALTMSRFRAADLVVETKPDLTPVSDADTEVERLVREALATDRPGDAVHGEEMGTTADPAHGRVWVVDPIDGTKNFVRGVPVWATLLALLDDGQPVVGVVSAPALGRRWWAARGDGAWLSEGGAAPRRLRVSGVARLEDASLSYSDPSWAAVGRDEAFAVLLERVWRARAYGDFWSHVLVAEGAVDVAAEPDLALWDVAAIVPVVREAGGQVSGYDGGPCPGPTGAVTSNGLLHAAVLAALAHPDPDA